MRDRFRDSASHVPYFETPVALTASNHSSTSLSTLLPDGAADAGGAAEDEVGAAVVVGFVAFSGLRAQLRSQ